MKCMLCVCMSPIQSVSCEIINLVCLIHYALLLPNTEEFVELKNYLLNKRVTI